MDFLVSDRGRWFWTTQRGWNRLRMGSVSSSPSILLHHCCPLLHGRVSAVISFVFSDRGKWRLSVCDGFGKMNFSHLKCHKLSYGNGKETLVRCANVYFCHNDKLISRIYWEWKSQDLMWRKKLAGWNTEMWETEQKLRHCVLRMKEAEWISFTSSFNFSQTHPEQTRLATK